MLDYVTLEDAGGTQVPFHGPATATRALVGADGLVGMAPVREVVRPRPGASGSLNRSRNLGDRLISFNGEVWGSSQDAAYSELDALQGAILDSVDAPRLLRYRRGADGLELQQLVQAAGDVKVPLSGGGRFLRYSAQLRASDPKAFAQAETVIQSAVMGETGGGLTYPVSWPATFVPGSAGVLTYENVGTAKTPPTFRIYGQVTNPRIRLGTTGPDLVFVGDVAAGHFLEVRVRGDEGRRQVLLDGVTPRLSLLDYGASSWFDLPRGTGTVRLLADSASADAYLELSYRTAYV